MRRVIVDYAKLTNEILNLLVEKFPDGYDDSNMDQGEFTPDMMLDYITQSTGLSPNPMDPNWGGADFTQELIDAGYYNDNNVAIAVNN